MTRLKTKMVKNEEGIRIKLSVSGRIGGAQKTALFGETLKHYPLMIARFQDPVMLKHRSDAYIVDALEYSLSETTKDLAGTVLRCMALYPSASADVQDRFNHWVLDVLRNYETKPKQYEVLEKRLLGRRKEGGWTSSGRAGMETVVEAVFPVGLARCLVKDLPVYLKRDPSYFRDWQRETKTLDVRLSIFGQALGIQKTIDEATWAIMPELFVACVDHKGPELSYNEMLGNNTEPLLKTLFVVLKENETWSERFWNRMPEEMFRQSWKDGPYAMEWLAERLLSAPDWAGTAQRVLHAMRGREVTYGDNAYPGFVNAYGTGLLKKLEGLDHWEQVHFDLFRDIWTQVEKDDVKKSGLVVSTISRFSSQEDLPKPFWDVVSSARYSDCEDIRCASFALLTGRHDWPEKIWKGFGSYISDSWFARGRSREAALKVLLLQEDIPDAHIRSVTSSVARLAVDKEGETIYRKLNAEEQEAVAQLIVTFKQHPKRAVRYWTRTYLIYHSLSNRKAQMGQWLKGLIRRNRCD